VAQRQAGKGGLKPPFLFLGSRDGALNHRLPSGGKARTATVYDF
jgi:hypothetical protein